MIIYYLGPRIVDHPPIPVWICPPLRQDRHWNTLNNLFEFDLYWRNP